MLLGNPVSQLNKKGDGNSRNPKYELNTVAMFASKEGIAGIYSL